MSWQLCRHETKRNETRLSRCVSSRTPLSRPMAPNETGQACLVSFRFQPSVSFCRNQTKQNETRLSRFASSGATGRDREVETKRTETALSLFASYWSRVRDRGIGRNKTKSFFPHGLVSRFRFVCCETFRFVPTLVVSNLHQKFTGTRASFAPLFAFLQSKYLVVVAVFHLVTRKNEHFAGYETWIRKHHKKGRFGLSGSPVPVEVPPKRRGPTLGPRLGNREWGQTPDAGITAIGAAFGFPSRGRRFENTCPRVIL